MHFSYKVSMASVLLSGMLTAAFAQPAVPESETIPGPAELTSEQIDQLRSAIEQVEEQFSTSPELIGAWADLDVRVTTGTVDATIYVDERHQARLLSATRRTLNAAFGSRLRERQVMQVAIAGIADQFNAIAESDRKLDGCFLDGGYFKPQVDANNLKQVMLFLVGRIPHEESRALVDRKVLELREAHPDWQQVVAADQESVRSKFTVGSSSLQLSHSEVLRGRQLYSDALAYYREGDFEQAQRTFRLAVVEQPDRLEYRFWLSSCALRRGDEAGSKQHLLAAAQRWNGRFSTADRRAVNNSLEEVQGWHRAKLHEFETRAVSSWYLRNVEAVAIRRVRTR